MKNRTYTYATSLSWGGDTPTAEHEVEVQYQVAWGSPERGNYGPPENYDPGSPDMVEDIKLLTVDGKSRPWGMGYGNISDDEFETMVVEIIEGEARHHEAMITAAIEEEDARDLADHLESMRPCW